MQATPGVYVATHPWLEAATPPLLKVGHTGDLGARLRDGAYITCFPPGWRYVCTFELASKAEAHLLETAVLHCCRHLRVDGRELVPLSAAALAELVERAAAVLGLAPVRRSAPAYPARERKRLPRPDPAEPAEWGRKRPAVERLTLPGPPEAKAPPACEPIDELGLSSLLVELGGLSLESPGPARAPEPRLPRVGAPPAAGEPPPWGAGFHPADLRLAEGLAGSLQLRDYQLDAVAAVRECIERDRRAVLQMACRVGKTPVAADLARPYLARGEAVLYLVPGLALLRQTAQKLAAFGLAAPCLLVGSDPRPVRLGGASGRALQLSMTTDPEEIRAFLAAPGGRLVVSTYQSSPLLPAAFAFAVFDEAHRVCGKDTPSHFNHTLLSAAAGHRLFMTATPVFDPLPISMKNRERFGNVAYRYHLRRGIAAGFVNDFRLVIVAASEPPPRGPEGKRKSPAAGPQAAGAQKPELGEAALPEQLEAAMAQVEKLFVFCRNIAQVERLAPNLAGRGFAVHVAHSRQGAGAADAALAAFALPGRALLLQVRLFQEGVEVPGLNGVFFAAPRHSPRDIIQSVCRPLNRVPDKPPSVVFLPALTDPARAADDPENLQRFASLIPFVDALLDEDPRLYEHLLDPDVVPYPLELIGTRSLALRRETTAALLAAARRGVRFRGASLKHDRLTRAEAVPWETAFGEIRRIVEQLNRYPKTVDRIVIGASRANLYAVYKHWTQRYREWAAGDRDALEPYQARALESLKGWIPFGVEGPYPWDYCLAALGRILEESKGVMPMLEINVGGFVGLSATDLERISGLATCVNQADGKDRQGRLPGSGFTLAAAKAAALDQLCGRFGLRWRKTRDAQGVLDPCSAPTCFQEAHARFKAYCREHGAGSAWIQANFPGYPAKHRKQEETGAEASALPPRKPGRGRWPRGSRGRGGRGGRGGPAPSAEKSGP